MILTAAHCLPDLPSPVGEAGGVEDTHYPKLLGPLGAKELTVWAQCMFVDPMADIAVLGGPDYQLIEEAEAYEALTDGFPPMPLAPAREEGQAYVADAGWSLVGMHN